MTIALTLPWPPSLNRYYRNVGGRVLISAEGRAYRTRVAKVIATERSAGNCGHRPMPERLQVHLLLAQPDRRRRDLDNTLKALLDALTHAGVWEDDSQIDDLHVVRGPVLREGGVLVTINEAVQRKAA